MQLDPEKRYKIPFVRGRQKAIRIKKAETNDYLYYSRFQLDALTVALSKLSPNAFKIWAWLNANKDSYCLTISYAEIFELTGMARATYTKAMQELVNKKYLRPGLLFSNFQGYIFVEDGVFAPPQEEELALEKKELGSSCAGAEVDDFMF